MTLHELMREPHNLFETWQEILSEYNASGKAVRDARLAAVLKANRIQYLVTFDSADFERFTFLHPASPQDLHLLDGKGGLT